MPQDLKLIGSNIDAITTLYDFVNNEVEIVIRDVDCLFITALRNKHFIVKVGEQVGMKMVSREGPKQAIFIVLDDVYSTGIRHLHTVPAQTYKNDIHNLNDGLRFTLAIMKNPAKYINLPDGVVF